MGLDHQSLGPCRRRGPQVYTYYARSCVQLFALDCNRYSSCVHGPPPCVRLQCQGAGCRFIDNGCQRERGGCKHKAKPKEGECAQVLDKECGLHGGRQRCVVLCPRHLADETGWASGSIEGRIAVEYFDPAPETQALKYAFRAHRQAVDGVDCVFPINALAYHPV